ncbi:HAD family phosphatase [Synechococcus sp. PCC 7336]|uniref:HAD family hydrolase n=1 Tax=Synechococcus sp. PCC 7336 TaxID=195250 RepID=UPI0003490CF3|nr:HAD family phosphatase [Synechococcus sp. PCC 7336]
MLNRDRIRAVVFDLDGLMLNTEPIYRLAWQRAVTDLGYELAGDWYGGFVGRSNEDCDRLLLEIFGREFPVRDCRGLREQHWRQHILANGIPLQPGLLELLDLLEALDIPKAIATASHRSEAQLSISAAGIGPRFAHAIAGDEVPNNKPAPDIYIQAARQLGVAPEHCLVFEDSNTGAKAAAAAGAVTVMVPDLQQPEPEVLSSLYRVLPSLHEACCLVEQMQAIGVEDRDRGHPARL